MKFKKGKTCDACQLGKQQKAPSNPKIKSHPVECRPLKLLHIDLFGPTRTFNLRGKRYAFVVIDDFSRFTWVSSPNKWWNLENIFKALKKDSKRNGFVIIKIKSGHSGEFKNEQFENFCNKHGIGIAHKLPTPRTSQQNGVIERKNTSHQDMLRTMLNAHNLHHYF